MSTQIQVSIAEHPFPDAWRPATPLRVAQSTWDEWRAGVIADLEELLWPAYNAHTGHWSRLPDPKLMESDFELLARLHDQLAELVKGRDGLSANPDDCIHRTFFDEEDGGLFGLRYERYDSQTPPSWRASWPDALLSGIGSTVGSLHYQLKKQFQRPRAYQVALLQNRDFRYIWAASGGTPSFVSGHCLQGSMGACAVFADTGSSLSASSVGFFQQFAVDIGDRRVFAGVHYPSDNLGSWYTALQLVPHVFDASVVSGVRRFLYEAITTRSILYAAIAKVGAVYAPALEAIDRVGRGG